MWKEHFKVIGIVPGKVVIPFLGTVDLSDQNLPEEIIKQAYDSGCIYLAPTKAGTAKYYPSQTKRKTPL